MSEPSVRAAHRSWPAAGRALPGSAWPSQAAGAGRGRGPGTHVHVCTSGPCFCLLSGRRVLPGLLGGSPRCRGAAGAECCAWNPACPADLGRLQKGVASPLPKLFCLPQGAAGCEDKGSAQKRGNRAPPPPRPGLLSEFMSLGGKDLGVWMLPTRWLQGIVGRASQAVEGDNPVFLERTDWEGVLLGLGLTCHGVCSEGSQCGAQGSSGSQGGWGPGGAPGHSHCPASSPPLAVGGSAVC